MYHQYTTEEQKFMQEYVYGHSYRQIQEAFIKQFGWEINMNQLKNYLKRNNLKTGSTGGFEEGHTPANKGKQMSPEVYEKVKATMFKKGNLPQTHKPVGTESIRQHKNRKNDKYMWVKIAEPDAWKMKHVLVWEKHHGAVPEGKIVIFLDGDHKNCEIDNLALVDRATHARLNQNHLRYQDKELTEAGINTARLMTALGDAKRNIEQLKKAK